MKLILMIRTVLWAFFGVRKKAGLDTDVKDVHPLQIIAVALVMAGVFIAILLAAASAAVNGL